MRKKIKDKDSALNKYINKALDEIDPGVLKTMVLNLGFEAFLNGTKTIRKMREKYNCNVPWLILMDPTSACNLHCTGCWAAEYGNRLNLTFDEMDSVVTQGKELGIYLYMFTGGEPLVRKSDIIKLCVKHNDCAFLSFTNGTLVDEAFCQEMKRVSITSQKNFNIMSAKEKEAAAKQTFTFLAPLTNEQSCEAGRKSAISTGS